MNPRPCLPSEAVLRALSLVGKGGQYTLGTGDFNPRAVVDLPWTQRRDHMIGSDCAGFAISWCFKLPRHRPGFNHGAWSTVEDDLNSNSAIEDSEHLQDLFTVAPRPEPGDLLAYPTIRLAGHSQPFVGHVVIVTSIRRVLEWDATMPDWSLLDIAECHGPDGHKPGITAGTGSHFMHHDSRWPKPAHRSKLLRALR